MKIKRFILLGFVSLLYVILVGPFAHSGAKLWTNIIFNETTDASTIALFWPSAFFYCLMALIFLLPGIAILALVLQINDEKVST